MSYFINMMSVEIHGWAASLYNNYQVLFWGFGRFSPTAFSRLWQMGPHMKALSPISDFSPFLAHSATLSYLYNNYQVLSWGFGRFSLTAFSRLWQIGPHMKALSPISDFSPFGAHSATLSYLLYNKYQVLFWGFGRFSPTAFSRLWQMGPHMKALSPRSYFSPFLTHSATLSYL